MPHRYEPSWIDETTTGPPRGTAGARRTRTHRYGPLGRTVVTTAVVLGSLLAAVLAALLIPATASAALGHAGPAVRATTAGGFTFAAGTALGT